MNPAYFSDPTVHYLNVSGENLCFNGQTHRAIRFLLCRLQPIRKRFHQGRLACHSPDARTSKDGQFCAFCPRRATCQRKLRLSLHIIDGATLTPAFFELNQSSFPALQPLLEQHGEQALKHQPITMKVVYDHHERTRIEFTLD